MPTVKPEPVGVHLICIAKQPAPGQVKTRLIPAYGPDGAAELAAASLRDTLHVLRRTPAVARTVAFCGDPDGWIPPDFAVVPQRGNGLDERLAAAIDDAWQLLPVPMLLVGMDTPQLRVDLLTAAADALLSPSCDAVLGPAKDGGWWSLGLRRPDSRLLIGVPMSSALTCREQRRRLHAAGLSVTELPYLLDVDVPTDVPRVAAELSSDSEFGAVAARLAAATDPGAL